MLIAYFYYLRHVTFTCDSVFFFFHFGITTFTEAQLICGEEKKGKLFIATERIT